MVGVHPEALLFVRIVSVLLDYSGGCGNRGYYTILAHTRYNSPDSLSLLLLLSRVVVLVLIYFFFSFLPVVVVIILCVGAAVMGKVKHARLGLELECLDSACRWGLISVFNLWIQQNINMVNNANAMRLKTFLLTLKVKPKKFE